MQINDGEEKTGHWEPGGYMFDGDSGCAIRDGGGISDYHGSSGNIDISKAEKQDITIEWYTEGGSISDKLTFWWTES